MERDPLASSRDRARVSGDLAVRFAGVLPDTVVEAAVERAARELRGQVRPGAFGEMLHRLAGYRLQQHVAAHASPE